MSDGKTVGECWNYNLETRDRVIGLQKEVEKVEEKLDDKTADIYLKLDATVERLSNRLPVWATLFISFLMLLVGGLLAKAVLK